MDTCIILKCPPKVRNKTKTCPAWKESFFLHPDEGPGSPRPPHIQARTLLSNEPTRLVLSPWGIALGGAPLRKHGDIGAMREAGVLTCLGLSEQHFMFKDSENPYSVGWTSSPQGARELRGSERLLPRAHRGPAACAFFTADLPAYIISTVNSLTFSDFQWENMYLLKICIF